MQILFTAFEADPFMKTGGLADVAGSMPAAVKALKGGEEADIRVMLPKYSGIPEKYKEQMQFLTYFYVDLSWRHEYCGILSLEHKGVTYYFLDSEKYFYRNQLYGDNDDCERMAFFSKACLEACLYLDGFDPDIIHCNDWHTALVPVYLREFYQETSLAKAKTIFTIHNLKFQGIYDPYVIGDTLGLHNTPADAQLRQWRDYSCCANFMLGACTYTDWITTVSPSYADEIRTPYYGEGLDWLFNMRRDSLSGILNGIDYEVWNPKTDPFLTGGPADAACVGGGADAAYEGGGADSAYEGGGAKKKAGKKGPAPVYTNYGPRSLGKKVGNKLALQKELGLTVDPDIPMYAVISRLTEQKGLDLVTYLLPHIAQAGMQLVVLGIGDGHFEEAFSWYAHQYPDKISAQIKFDNSLSHKLYAAADVMLIPSRFEPCGLTQLIAMKYACLPLVRETGGLKDTVNSGNGFSFLTFNADDMKYALDCSLDIWYNNRAEWLNKQKQAVSADYSWESSAKVYKELYLKLLES